MLSSQRVTDDLVKVVPVDTAEELLDELSPHRGQLLWNRPDTQWLFRGQAEAFWTLKPAVFRKDTFKDLLPSHVDTDSSPAQRLNVERHLVFQFGSSATALGFEIPWDGPEFRDRRIIDERPFPDGSNYPPNKEWGLFALAQHYGIPTRLLDWTRKQLFAAYFAALKPADRHYAPAEGSDGRLAVWAIQQWFIEDVCGKWNPSVAVVTVPTESNPYLYAQMGAFTLVSFSQVPKPLINIPDLDDLFRDPANVSLARDVPHRGPMLFQFTLPHKEAGALLHYLFMQEVSAATVYPGRHSIVALMKEKNLYEERRPPERT